MDFLPWRDRRFPLYAMQMELKLPLSQTVDMLEPWSPPGAPSLWYSGPHTFRRPNARTGRMMFAED